MLMCPIRAVPVTSEQIPHPPIPALPPFPTSANFRRPSQRNFTTTTSTRRPLSLASQSKKLGTGQHQWTASKKGLSPTLQYRVWLLPLIKETQILFETSSNPTVRVTLRSLARNEAHPRGPTSSGEPGSAPSEAPPSGEPGL